jgi:hypothetical protein
MGHITLKVNSELFLDSGYRKLSDMAKATFWEILAVAGTAGIEVAQFRWISHGGSRRLLNMLRDGGLIKLEIGNDGLEMIIPTGRVAQREVCTARHKKWRSSKRNESSTTSRKEEQVAFASPTAVLKKSGSAPPLHGPSDKVEEPSHRAVPLTSESLGMAEPQVATEVGPSAFDAHHPFDTDDEGDPGVSERPQSIPAAQGAIQGKVNLSKQPHQPIPVQIASQAIHEAGILPKLLADGLPPNLAQEWLAIREKKKQPLTSFLWEETKAEAEHIDWPLTEAIRFAVIKGWAGILPNFLRHIKPPDAKAETAGGANVVRPKFFSGNTGRGESHMAAQRAERARTRGVCL